MSTLPAKSYLSSGTSRTEGEVKTNYFDKILDVLAELPGGAESVPEYTISSGAIIPAAAVFTVDTESDAATDDLTNITTTNMPEGRLVFFRANNSARTVVVKHESGGAGQISTAEGNDITLDDAAKWVVAVRNGADWEVVSVGGNQDALTSSTYTNNQTIAVAAGSKTRDLATVNVLSGASSDTTFTVASLSASDDGKYFRFLNDDEYQLTITPTDSTVAIWNSGDGYGIDLPYKGTAVTLQYDHSRLKLDIVEKTGGLVKIEGLVLHEPMHTISLNEAESASRARKVDLTQKHMATIENDVNADPYSKLPPGCWNFPGFDEYVYYEDSADWDIFGDQTGHKTIAGWVRFDTTGITNYILSQWEDITHLWYLARDNDDRFAFIFEYGAENSMSLIGSLSSVSASTWYHVALVINGSNVGLYVDGSQIDYDNTWYAATFTNSLYVGQIDGGGFFDGRMQDLHISYNNPYNADPQSDNSDSFTVPNAPFQGVMK